MSEASPSEAPGAVGPRPGRARVRFGIFDWLDERKPLEMSALYEDRLKVLEYADAAGYDYYFLAEHHWTPLCMAPSPNLFLTAVAQRTLRIRLGPMVYVLPLYNPLRLIEEICMLDHLSNGRLEMGVGRGASPYEMAPFHVPIEEARPIFDEALAIILQGLSTGRVDYEGRYFAFRDVQAVQRPQQQPYPPLWYPTNYPHSVPWIGRHSLHTMFGSLFPSLEATREQLEIYNRERERHQGDPDRLNAHVSDPCYGIARHVYVAETDEQAKQEAKSAYADYNQSFGYLWAAHGDTRIHRPEWEGFVAQGSIFVGSPATVRARVQEAMDITGANFFAGAFIFGTLTVEQTLRSLRLFAEQVMPAFR
jgi:alkanesulfonate monooxygenase SsuD/methylene tetrahydromethanopterin reductase-like flavin-dependent oxidoreductase (luciferase family)